MLSLAAKVTESAEKCIKKGSEYTNKGERIGDKQQEIAYRQAKCARPFGVHIAPLKYIASGYVLVYISLMVDNTISLLLAF